MSCFGRKAKGPCSFPVDCIGTSSSADILETLTSGNSLFCISLLSNESISVGIWRSGRGVAALLLVLVFGPVVLDEISATSLMTPELRSLEVKARGFRRNCSRSGS